MKTQEQLWQLAQERAKVAYEEECGDWEVADKYEREDWVFSEYKKLEEATK